jgi:CHASE3 domain sensor protein
MSIMKKQLLGFSSIILLLAIITGITYGQFYSVNKNYSETIDDRTEKTKLATYAIFETYKEQNFLRN